MKALDKFLDIMGFSEIQEDDYFEENEPSEYLSEWKKP